MRVEYAKYDYYPLPVFKNRELLERADIGFPAPYLGTSLLCCYSGIIGSKFRLKVRNTYKLANLYAANIGKSGSYKTPSMEIFTRKIHELNKRTWREFHNFNNSYPDQAKDFNDKQFLISNGTQEGIVKLMALNNEGLISIQDELSSFFNGMNMYRSHGRGNDKEFFIQLYDGTYIPHLLKNQPNHIIEPDSVMTILGNSTFDALRKVIDVNHDDGLKERFIFAVIPERKFVRIPEDDYSIKFFNDHLEHLFLMYRTWRHDSSLRQNFKEVLFTDKYEEIFFDWFDEINKTQNSTLQSYLNKTKRFFWKFCLILAVIYDVGEINQEIAENSIKLLQYYYSSYKYLFNLAQEDPLSELTEAQRKMWEVLPNEFKFSEGYRIIKEKGIASETTFNKFIQMKYLFVKHNNIYKKITETVYDEF